MITLAALDAAELLRRLKASQALRKEKNKEHNMALHDDLTWEVCGCPDDLETADA